MIHKFSQKSKILNHIFPALLVFVGSVWILWNPLPPFVFHSWQVLYVTAFVNVYVLGFITLIFYWYRRRTSNKPLSFSFLLLGILWLLTFSPILGHNVYTSFWISNMLALLLVVLGLLRFPSFKMHWQARIKKITQLFFVSEPRYFLMTFFAFFVFLTSILSHFAFGGLPHVLDSVEQYMNSRAFIEGSLFFNAHPLQEFFGSTFFVEIEDRLFSQYPPGHMLSLALGRLVGAPWAVNPVLGGLTLVLVYKLACQVDSEKTARIAVLLFLLSPFTVWMSSEYMNHASALLWFMVMMNGIVAWVQGPNFKNSLLIGLGAGMLAITRPYTSLALTLPVMALMSYFLVTEKKRLFSVFISAIPALFLLTFLLYYNQQTTGDPFKLGYMARWGEATIPGFGSRFDGDYHDFLSGVENTLRNIVGLNYFLFMWPVPALFFVFAAYYKKAFISWQGFWAVQALSLIGFYFLYSFQDWTFGPRFLYEISGLLIILVAQGMRNVWRLSQDIFVQKKSQTSTTSLVVFIVILFCFAAMKMYAPLYQLYARDFGGVSSTLFYEIEETLKNKKSLVFTNSKTHNFIFNNPPQDADSVIYVLDLEDKENQKMINFYPDRALYLEKNCKLFTYYGQQEVARYTCDDPSKRKPVWDIHHRVKQNPKKKN